MSQMFNKVRQSTRIQIAIEEERYIPIPDRTLTTDNLLTFGAELAAMGVTTDLLVGQHILVVDRGAAAGSNKGKSMMVSENTTTTITLVDIVEGTDRWEKFPANLGVTEPLVCSTRGIPAGVLDPNGITFGGSTIALTTPSITEMFGPFDQTPLPEPAHSVDEKWGFGSENMPGRHYAIHNRTSYEATMPLSAVLAKRLFLGFGKVIEYATDFVAAGGSTTLDGTHCAGMVTLEVAAILNFSNGDWIQIGDTTDGEIRKIVGIPAGTELILDRPLRRSHASAETVKEIDPDCYDGWASGYTSTIDPLKFITHVLSWGHGLPTASLEVNFGGEYDDCDQDKWINYYVGLLMSELSFKSSTNNELLVDCKVSALGAKKNPSNITKAAFSNSEFYSGGDSLKPAHFSRSFVEFESVKWRLVEDISFSISREVDTIYSHAFTDGAGLKLGRDPFAHVPGRATAKATFAVPVANDRLWDLVAARASMLIGAEFGVLRGTSAFYEIWTFALSEVILENAPMDAPNTPVIRQTVSGPPSKLTLTVVDKMPSY